MTGVATAVTQAHSSPRRTPYHDSAATAIPVAAMKPDSAMCRCETYSNSEGLNASISARLALTLCGPIPSSRNEAVKFRMKKMTPWQ
jgi:hypothetical protein